jgi:hypothetical protein
VGEKGNVADLLSATPAGDDTGGALGRAAGSMPTADDTGAGLGRLVSMDAPAADGPGPVDPRAAAAAAGRVAGVAGAAAHATGDDDADPDAEAAEPAG